MIRNHRFSTLLITIIALATFGHTVAQSDPCTIQNVLSSFQAAALSNGMRDWSERYDASTCSDNVKQGSRLLTEAYNRLSGQKGFISNGNLSVDQVWSGVWWKSGSSSEMILSLTEVTQTNFEGTIYWPQFGKTTTSLSGHIITDFGSGAELTRWQNIRDFSQTLSGMYVIFTQPSTISGGGVLLNTSYYAHVRTNGTIVGVEYRNRDDVTPVGEFMLLLKE